MSTENIQLVEMRNITRDPKFQVRNQLDPKLVKQYAVAMSNGADFPPIHLAQVGTALFIVDGWHRQAAQHSLGKHEVCATVTPMTEDEALRASALANSKHGKPLKASERRNVFQNFILGNGHMKANGRLMSYREISEALGGHVGHTTVFNWMKADFPSICEDMGVGVERGKGNGERPPLDVQAGYYREAVLAFHDGLSMYKLFTSPVARHELIQQVEQALAVMKTYEQEAPEF
jgi:hypothetical protein